MIRVLFTALLLLSLASPLWAAIAHDVSTPNTSSASTTGCSFSHTPSGTPTLVLFWIGLDAPETIDSNPTYGGQATTFIGNSGTTTNAGDQKVHLYYLANPPSGTQTATAGFSTDDHHTCLVQTFTGTGTSNPIVDWNAYDNGGSACTTATTTIALAETTNWMVTFSVWHGGDTDPFTVEESATDIERGEGETGTSTSSDDGYAYGDSTGDSGSTTHTTDANVSDECAQISVEISETDQAADAIPQPFRSIINPQETPGALYGDWENPNFRRGLIGAWKGFRPSGNKVFDSSGFGNHGAFSGMVPETDWIINRLNWSTGYVIDVDGTNDVISLGSAPTLQPVAFSIVAFIKPRRSDSANRAAIFTSGWDFASTIGIRFTVYQAAPSADYAARLNIGSGSVVNTTVSDGDIVDDEWTHLVGSFDGNTARLWVDGILQADVDTGVTLTYNTNGAYIGGDGVGADSYLAAQIDHVLLYDRSLSMGEVHSLQRDPHAWYRKKQFVSWLSPAAPAAGRRIIVISH